MNSFFSLVKPAPKTESIDSLKIYIGEELRKFKILPVPHAEIFEAENAIKNLWDYTDVKRAYGGDENLDRLYLMLTIQSVVDKSLVLKRRIQSLENIKSIAASKPVDKDYIWSLQINADTGAGNKFEDPEKLESEILNMFKARRNDTEERKSNLT